MWFKKKATNKKSKNKTVAVHLALYEDGTDTLDIEYNGVVDDTVAILLAMINNELYQACIYKLSKICSESEFQKIMDLLNVSLDTMKKAMSRPKSGPVIKPSQVFKKNKW